jgi:ectoine hydroxylase-related dioxygenase (phytanoyl-CoA dioxygenase family)
MNADITAAEIEKYQNDGFLVIDDFLNSEELEVWRAAVTQAVKERNGIKIPGTEIKTTDDDGTNSEFDYFSNVFDQLLNLWQTNEQVKELILDKRIGKMAAQLAGVDGIRAWHDQALIKRPWANPTAWHLDTPFWSFDSRNSISIWIALDDATLENGCLFFIPDSYKHTTYENPGITKNMNAIFDFYPAFKNAPSVAAPMKAGSCSFHNGLTIHGAHANMTSGFRRAMTCAFMPDGAVFNGKKNVLPDDYFNSLKIGDVLNNDDQNPLIYHKDRD